ncbi:ROK family protein [Virgibacillus halodenitrificans]|uniref:ROK family protein n=1 Tax=Virgibacillus halodenitrificans TaxID=1482 RepID=UPI0024BF847C|nr:ROK family protein [Virgibacillus halodenitrificans]WHX26248.1 ROK family protein [Virgibacillus halodenitrificans]
MYTIGIDIGGTKIRYGLFADDVLVDVGEMTTPQNEIVKSLTRELRAFIGEKTIKGVGIASAGIVASHEGKVKKAANLQQIVNVPLGEMLKYEFKAPVMLENDANCAALAEAKLGAAKGTDSSICITIGTGIGGGIIYKGNVVNGRNGYGGEVGHMVVEPNGTPCGCGRSGCWERYASGTAIQQMIDQNTVLTAKKYTPNNVFKHVNENNECRNLMNQFVDSLVNGLVNLQYIFDPDVFVLGGGVTDSSEIWWNQLTEKLSQANISINVRQAHFQNDASMIGASYLLK